MLRKLVFIIALFANITSVVGRSLILEFKGAYFLPTDCNFKSIYHHGSGMYGPEFTFQLCNERNLYGFASIDYFQKKGTSVGLCNPTKVQLIPLAFGLKYFFPVHCDLADFYLGLGFQAVDVRTKNCSPFVTPCLSKWGFGGIAKAGVYWNLPCNFVIDLFIDYSFVKTSNGCQRPVTSGPQPIRANVSGAIFGLGLGYRF